MWKLTVFILIFFRAELNRQKQRSHDLELQLVTAHDSIAGVCVTHTSSPIKPVLGRV